MNISWKRSAIFGSNENQVRIKVSGVKLAMLSCIFACIWSIMASCMGFTSGSPRKSRASIGVQSISILTFISKCPDARPPGSIENSHENHAGPAVSLPRSFAATAERGLRTDRACGIDHGKAAIGATAPLWKANDLLEECMRQGLIFAASAAVLLAAGSPALAQELTVGVTISATGPAAALGIPIKNTIELLPTEIGGVKVKIIQLDDAGDSTTATTNARRLITKSKVDVLIGSSTTPPTIAVSTVANEAAIPHFTLAPMPVNDARAKWSVVMPQPVPLMAKVMFEHMKKNNVKTVGLIGFSDSWGDLWLNEFKNQGVPMGLELVADERFARPDTSVAGQVLKLVLGEARRRAGCSIRHGRRPAPGHVA